jgi:hypothetical protein
MKYYIDVDGVIRRWVRAIGLEKEHTSWIVIPDDIWIKMDADPKKYLYDCDCYEDIVNFVKELMIDNDVTFLTNQKGIEGREFWTKKFVQKVFGDDINIIFTTNFQEKVDVLLKDKNSMLIDDYPDFHLKEGFEDVKDQIILVRRIWNQDFIKHYSFALYDDKASIDIWGKPIVLPVSLTGEPNKLIKGGLNV